MEEEKPHEAGKVGEGLAHEVVKVGVGRPGGAAEAEEDVKPAMRVGKKRASAGGGSAGKRARTSVASDYSGIEVVEPPPEPPLVRDLRARASAADQVRSARTRVLVLVSGC